MKSKLRINIRKPLLADELFNPCTAVRMTGSVPTVAVSAMSDCVVDPGWRQPPRSSMCNFK